MLISEKKLEEIFKKFENLKIAIIGDLMLDRYLWGNVTRISPEAPVPIVEIDAESNRLGGAANVANNVKSLGGIPLLFGVIGNDRDGEILINLLKSSGFEIDGIRIDSFRSTTVKTRVIAHNQHIVRVDRENRNMISEGLEKDILKIFSEKISQIDAVIIEDYNKGVITKNLISGIVEICRKNGKIVNVDPKFNNFFEYKNVTVFKPNRKETEEALGMKLINENLYKMAASKLINILNAESIIITRSENGMFIMSKDMNYTSVPTTARKVADVSGAGDTVISTLTMAMASGADLIESAILANTAGGIVCGEVGIVPVDKNELLQTLLEDMNHRPRNR